MVALAEGDLVQNADIHPTAQLILPNSPVSRAPVPASTHSYAPAFMRAQIYTSCSSPISRLAQLVERVTSNDEVSRSSRLEGSQEKSFVVWLGGHVACFSYLFIWRRFPFSHEVHFKGIMRRIGGLGDEGSHLA